MHGTATGTPSVYELYFRISDLLDDDIISPLWDFIEIDSRKQNRAAHHVTNVKTSRPVRTRRKLMSSRSGYRGIKLLKKL